MDAKQPGKDGAHKGSPQGKALLNTGIAYLYGQDGATDYDVARECFQKAWLVKPPLIGPFWLVRR